jgi:ketosteroid isomerase-like protein
MKFIKIYFLALICLLITQNTAAHANQISKSKNEKTMINLAQKAFDAWAKGENKGDYTDFKALLTDKFQFFSHPLEGKFTGKEGLSKIQKLIAQREKVSNQLVFSQIKINRSENEFVFAFNSEGTVAGGYAYKGFNIIVLGFDNGVLNSFSEYFGFIDPAWFKN